MLGIRDRLSGAMALRGALCAFVLVLAGCQGEQRQEEVASPATPDPAMLSISSDYAARAIDAAGGLDAWTKTKELHLTCVVTLYQPDGSDYLSEQRYAIHPWSNSIQMSATEPQETSVWQLSAGRFDVLEGRAQIEELSAAAPARCLAEAILNIVTAPARLLDTASEFIEQDSPVRIQGQWYQPIDRRANAAAVSGGPMAKAVFYQDRDSALIDLIHVACGETGRVLAVRGYDYDEIQKDGLVVPRRIEVFTTDTQGGSQLRLVRIDCHQVGPAQ